MKNRENTRNFGMVESGNGTRRRPLRRVALALAGLALVAAAPTAAGQLRQPRAIEARVDFYTLLCLHETGEGNASIYQSDEVFCAGSWKMAPYGGEGKITLPYKKVSYITSPTNPSVKTKVVTYPHYGDVDKYEWVFDDRRIIWQGTLLPGQEVVIPMSCMERDSGYTAGDFAEDMMKHLQSAIKDYIMTGTISYSTMAKALLDTLRFVFGCGANDELGHFTVVLKNNFGKLTKELRCHDYTYFGGGNRKLFKVVQKYDNGFYQNDWKSELDHYLNDGYKIEFTNTSGLYTTYYHLYKWKWYPKLSSTGKTIRMVLDGDGCQKYLASIQVRQGPFTSTKPEGDAQVWTVTNCKLAK